jgi:hypothetical protein
MSKKCESCGVKVKKNPEGEYREILVAKRGKLVPQKAFFCGDCLPYIDS